MKKKRISVSAKVLSGKPHIQGTRVSVEQVLACLSEGWSHKEIINEFEIMEEDIRACIDFAYQAVSKTHFVNSSGKVYA